MDIQLQKRELRDWLTKVEDPTLLSKLSKIMEDVKTAEKDEEDYILDETKIRSLTQISQWWENLV